MSSPALRSALPAVPRARSAEIGELFLVSFQLVLVLLVLHGFQLESRTFFHVMMLGAAGFVVHSLLPMHLRLPFFATLSIAAVLLALGLADGGFLLAFGLLLIGVCHLPASMGTRVGLLLVLGVLLALWRVELLPAAWSTAIWPILASMFMFRIALYLHALHHGQESSPAHTLAYFFMLPNVCFPLFPVIDYTTFRRTYYDQEAARIHQTGMKWIARGLVHLILYRVVYVHFTEDPMQLQTLGELVKFLLATFLLYLRVSGQFHLIVGILHLFGFRLPETHHLYFLAANFQDFWRRINIYWKDFMMKLVYYPSFFRLRRFGTTTALVAATLTVFFSTWLLHSYQWFWLRGGFPLHAQDGLFWGVLAAFVVIGSVREMKRPRARKRGRGPAWSASLALRTVGTFTVICVLWSLWSAESVTSWLLMWDIAGNVAPGDWWLVGGLLAIGLLIGGRAWPVAEDPDPAALPFLRRPVVLSTATLLALVALGSQEIYGSHAPQLASAVASVQRSTLNARDADLQHMGYYENLDNVGRLDAQLWEVQARRPAHWVPLRNTEAYRERDDFLECELRPATSITFLDQPLSTNRWGMRDKEVSQQKPEGTYRVAVLGPSHVMGSGVPDGATFTMFLEERLNRSPLAWNGVRFEVLNFGVPDYSLSQQLGMFEERVRNFEPDAVFVTESPRLTSRLVSHVVSTVAHGREIPVAALAAIVQRAEIASVADEGLPVPFETSRTLLGAVGVKTRMPYLEGKRRLAPAADELVRATLDAIAASARQIDAVPVFLALDNVVPPPAEPMQALHDAGEAQLLVFDLLGLWEGREMEPLRIAPWDDHPNVAANQLIADRLLELMVQHRDQLQLDRDPSTIGRASYAEER